MDSATALYNQLKAAEPFFLLVGPNLIESEEHIMRMAKSIKTIASKYAPFSLDLLSCFDKANRTSSKSFRGPGMSEGLKILEKVKIAYDIPIVIDVHESIQCEEVGKVSYIIQIPSFLCRQTDLLVATAKTGKIINNKKGQFCAPSVMVNSVEKVRLAGNPNVMVCEREQCLDTTDAVDPKSRHKGKLLICVCENAAKKISLHFSSTNDILMMFNSGFLGESITCTILDILAYDDPIGFVLHLTNKIDHLLQYFIEACGVMNIEVQPRRRQ
ncbi:hypothetical protein UlMin_004130 [Ulmus minor]